MRSSILEQTIVTDDRATVRPGDRVYNYYDMEPGTIRPGSLTVNGNDVWFDFETDKGRTRILNGQRICTIAFAKRRGFRDA